jgi:MFS family permease
MMVLGALFFAAGPFFYPLIQDPLSLLALRFVHGFATEILSPVASAYAAGLAATGWGARLGWFSSANNAGATAGPLLGGFLLYVTASYPVTHLAVGAHAARGAPASRCRCAGAASEESRRTGGRTAQGPR